MIKIQKKDFKILKISEVSDNLLYKDSEGKEALYFHDLLKNSSNCELYYHKKDSDLFCIKKLESVQVFRVYEVRQIVEVGSYIVIHGWDDTWSVNMINGELKQCLRPKM